MAKGSVAVVVVVACFLTALGTWAVVRSSGRNSERVEMLRRARRAADATERVYLHAEDSTVGFSTAVNTAEQATEEFVEIAANEKQKRFAQWLGDQLPRASACRSLMAMTLQTNPPANCPSEGKDMREEAEQKMAQL